MEQTQGSALNLGWKTIGIGLLFWLPLLSGVVSRFVKHKIWFGDYNATACAAEKMLAGEPYYSRALECPGMTLSGYVYHPAVAGVFAWPIEQFGAQAVMIAFAAIYIAAIAFMIWVLVGRKAAAPRGQRNWFAAFLVGSAVYWGNLAVVLHGLIAACALLLRKRPSMLALAIAAAIVVKPLFVTFTAVFALARWPLWRRAAYVIAAAAMGAAPVLWFLQNGGALAAQWRELVTYYVSVDRPGDSFLGWVALLGGDVAAPATFVAYALFAGAMMTAALVIAEGLDLDDDSRALLGLSMGVLLLPRLMGVDYWLLGPGLVCAATALGGADARRGTQFERALLGICVIALIGNMADLADYTTKLAMLAFALLILAAAAIVLAERRTTPAALWRQIWRGAAPAAG